MHRKKVNKTFKSKNGKILNISGIKTSHMPWVYYINIRSINHKLYI